METLQAKQLSSSFCDFLKRSGEPYFFIHFTRNDDIFIASENSLSEIDSIQAILAIIRYKKLNKKKLVKYILNS